MCLRKSSYHTLHAIIRQVSCRMPRKPPGAWSQPVRMNMTILFISTLAFIAQARYCDIFPASKAARQAVTSGTEAISGNLCVVSHRYQFVAAGDDGAYVLLAPKQNRPRLPDSSSVYEN